MNERAPTVAELISALNGKVHLVEQRGPMDRIVTAITDDSRAVRPGSLFVAVKGERVDGHQFVSQAVKAGAAAVMAQEFIYVRQISFALPSAIKCVTVSTKLNSEHQHDKNIGEAKNYRELFFFHDLGCLFLLKFCFCILDSHI